MEYGISRLLVLVAEWQSWTCCGPAADRIKIHTDAQKSRLFTSRATLCDPPFVVDHLRQARRVRALGSDARAGEWARGRVRLLWWHFARRTWRFLATVFGLGALLTAIILTTAPGDLLRGFLAGVMATLTVGGSWFFVAYMSGSASASMGAVAEQWTASELRRLDTEGWRLVNGFHLRVSDIDHVLIGPAGVIAVETKWSRDAWRLRNDDSTLASATDQVSRNVWALEHWDDLKRLNVAPVRSALFLWSGEPVPAPAPAGHLRLNGAGQVQMLARGTWHNLGSYEAAYAHIWGYSGTQLTPIYWGDSANNTGVQFQVPLGASYRVIGQTYWSNGSSWFTSDSRMVAGCNF